MKKPGETIVDAVRTGDGEQAVQAGFVAACYAATEGAGAVFCDELVQYAWPWIKDGLVWLGGAFQDAMWAVVPGGLRAHGVACWTCQADAAAMAWRHQVKEVWEKNIAEELGLSVEKVRADLEAMMWRGGKPMGYRMVDNPDSRGWVTSQSALPYWPDDQQLPWDKHAYGSWTVNRWWVYRLDVPPWDMNGIQIAGDWGDNNSNVNMADLTRWMVDGLRISRWAPWEAAALDYLFFDKKKGSAPSNIITSSPATTVLVLGGLGAGAWWLWSAGYLKRWLGRIW